MKGVEQKIMMKKLIDCGFHNLLDLNAKKE